VQKRNGTAVVFCRYIMRIFILHYNILYTYILTSVRAGSCSHAAGVTTVWFIFLYRYIWMYGGQYYSRTRSLLLSLLWLYILIYNAYGPWLKVGFGSSWDRRGQWRARQRVVSHPFIVTTFPRKPDRSRSNCSCFYIYIQYLLPTNNR